MVMDNTPRIKGLGRRHAPDSRDARYPMTAVLRAKSVPVSRYYQTGHLLPLDQGETGTCVAHACVGFLAAALTMNAHPGSPFDLYRLAVQLDEFDDNDAEAKSADADLQMGTSVRGGVKALQQQGHIQSYVWARSADEMAQWLLTGHGTVILGTDWEYGMTELDHSFYARVIGGVQGGHSYLCIGYNRITRAFRCLNSWGPDWGQKGRFWITYDDMQTLLDRNGEACAAVEQKVAPVS